MKEIWKQLSINKSYLISNKGNIRSVDRYVKQKNRWGTINDVFKKGVILKPTLDKKGYFVVSISVDGVKKQKWVHRLVLETFDSNKKDSKLVVDHIDNNHTNNKISNLRWVTHRENVTKDRKRRYPQGVSLHKHGKFTSRIYIDGKRRTLGYWDTAQEASEAYQLELSKLN